MADVGSDLSEELEPTFILCRDRELVRLVNQQSCPGPRSADTIWLEVVSCLEVCENILGDRSEDAVALQLPAVISQPLLHFDNSLRLVSMSKGLQR